jgi:hypothetical protein
MKGSLKQTMDGTDVKLTWAKATGTPDISSQMDTFTATGTNTSGYS